MGNDVEFVAEIHMPRISGLSGLFDERLPINRKERYYTGTVLPMIVASDGFKHFGKFLALCGIPEIALEADPNTTNVQFFSEYGFKESLMNGAEKRFRDPGGRDTPDLVVYMERSLLLGVEAKFFDQPSIADDYTWMGRRGGLDGPELREDVENGMWENREYEVRHDRLPDNPNWFPVADFIKMIERSG